MRGSRRGKGVADRNLDDRSLDESIEITQPQVPEPANDNEEKESPVNSVQDELLNQDFRTNQAAVEENISFNDNAESNAENFAHTVRTCLLSECS